MIMIPVICIKVFGGFYSLSYPFFSTDHKPAAISLKLGKKSKASKNSVEEDNLYFCGKSK